MSKSSVFHMEPPVWVWDSWKSRHGTTIQGSGLGSNCLLLEAASPTKSHTQPNQRFVFISCHQYSSINSFICSLNTTKDLQDAKHDLRSMEAVNRRESILVLK